jgi:hypothetical protein
MMKTAITLILLMTVHLPLGSFADEIGNDEDQLCEPKAEAAAEKLESECSLKEQKSKKSWKTVEAAEKAITLAIKNQNVASLSDYIGCDSSDSSTLHYHCSADKIVLSTEDLQTLLTRSTGHSPLKSTRWIRYGVGNKIHVWCTKDYGFKAAKNYCGDDAKLQPIIEITKSKTGYYIFGLPLTGVKN